MIKLPSYKFTMYFDPVYFLFIGPGLIVALLAHFYLRISYGSNSRVSAGSGLTGMQAAEKLNEAEGFGVKFVTSQGQLNDYFDPIRHIVNLSSDNVTNSSVANIAVVAHEFGHVQQKQSGMALFKVRSFMVPAVNFGSGLGIVLIMIGLGFAFTGLTWAGIILFSLTALFSLVTLPIEFDASRRGLALIKKYNLIEASKMPGARSVLTAAALTYVAALIQSIGQLLYYVMLAQGRRD